MLNQAPLAELDYLEFVESETLEPTETVDRPTLARAGRQVRRGSA